MALVVRSNGDLIGSFSPYTRPNFRWNSVGLVQSVQSEVGRKCRVRGSHCESTVNKYLKQLYTGY